MKQNTRIDPGPADWLSAVRHYEETRGDELELAALAIGDSLQVRTNHTLYDFTWEGAGMALLMTDRKDRPYGRVRINGCALGSGKTIAPGRLFNGGSLEFRSAEGRYVHRTTAIKWIRLVRMLG